MDDEEFGSEMNFNLLPLPPRYLVPGEKKPRHLAMGDFRIPPTPFTAGAQGQIYRVGFKFGDGSLTTPQGDIVKAFAMKKLPKRKLQKEKKELLSFKTELNTLFDLYHPNIVRYITHFQDNNNFFIVMEFLEGGNLYNRLVKNKKKVSSPFQHAYNDEKGEQPSLTDLNDLLPEVAQTPRLQQTGYDFGLENFPSKKATEVKAPQLDKPFTVKQAIKLGKDILLALQYLHSKNIMHRDIKLENILLDKNGNAKLADFGYLCVLRDHFRFTVCGTDVYMAPQVHSGKYGFQAEIYSCGVLFFEMLTGNIQSNQIPQNGFPPCKFPPSFENLYPEVCELVQKMLVRNPVDRISIEEALEHKAMRRYNKKAPQINQDKKLVDESLVTQLRRELQKRDEKIKILQKIIERQNHEIKQLRKNQPPLFPDLHLNDKPVPQTSEEIDQILVGRKATKKKLNSESGVSSSIDFEEIKQKGGKFGTPGKVDSTSNSLQETAKFRDSSTPQHSSDTLNAQNSQVYLLSFGHEDPASTVESGPDSNSGANSRKGKQTPRGFQSYMPELADQELDQIPTEEKDGYAMNTSTVKLASHHKQESLLNLSYPESKESDDRVPTQKISANDIVSLESHHRRVPSGQLAKRK